MSLLFLLIKMCAVIRRIAVGTPIGLSFFGLFGSLSQAFFSIPTREVSPLVYKTFPFVRKTCLFFKTCPHPNPPSFQLSHLSLYY
jgi:hypothetical protein